MQPTSLQAYHEIAHTLPQKRRAVFEAIHRAGEQGATLFELVDALGWPVNRVSGRVTELKEAQAIADTGERRKNPETRMSAIVWRTV